MRIISWNVNGINACEKKGLVEFIHKSQADVICIQETKSPTKATPALIDIKSYEDHWVYAEKKGYSGVMSYIKKTKSPKIIEGIGIEEFDKEGRVQILEFKHFHLINVYFPNSGRDLKRLPYKLKFNNDFLKFCERLRKSKPIIICGDFNVAHEEIDLTNPKKNQKTAGFTPQEREWFTEFLSHDYIDTFREFIKEPNHYTYWSYRYNAREKNIGWRVDYFVVSTELRSKVKESYILKEVTGSDHCPIGLLISD